MPRSCIVFANGTENFIFVKLSDTEYAFDIFYRVGIRHFLIGKIKIADHNENMNITQSIIIDSFGVNCGAGCFIDIEFLKKTIFSSTATGGKNVNTNNWVNTGLQVKGRDGRKSIGYKNIKTGEIKVKRKQTDGTFKYVK